MKAQMFLIIYLLTIVAMGAKFYKYEVKVGGARSECRDRPFVGSEGLAPQKKIDWKIPRYRFVTIHGTNRVTSTY